MKQQTPKENVELINDNIEEFDKAMELFKQEPLEEYFLDNIKNVLQFGNDVQAIRFMEKYFEAKKERSYSEEEVENILIEYVKTNPTKPYRVISWFTQFKKK
jgi:hypothetical protein